MPIPSLAKLIADLKKVRATLPESARADLDQAIAALERALGKTGG